VALGAHHDVPLLISGQRGGPDLAALALAQELPTRYAGMQRTIENALFEHYQPYRDAFNAGQIDDPIALLANPPEVWPYVRSVHIIAAPVRGRLTIEIGYSVQWDIEHTLGAIVADWRLVELNGSVIGVARW
jgi:hypothetical protein